MPASRLSERSLCLVMLTVVCWLAPARPATAEMKSLEGKLLRYNRNSLLIESTAADSLGKQLAIPVNPKTNVYVFAFGSLEFLRPDAVVKLSGEYNAQSGVMSCYQHALGVYPFDLPPKSKSSSVTYLRISEETIRRGDSIRFEFAGVVVNRSPLQVRRIAGYESPSMMRLMPSGRAVNVNEFLPAITTVRLPDNIESVRIEFSNRVDLARPGDRVTASITDFRPRADIVTTNSVHILLDRKTFSPDELRKFIAARSGRTSMLGPRAGSQPAAFVLDPPSTLPAGAECCAAGPPENFLRVSNSDLDQGVRR